MARAIGIVHQTPCRTVRDRPSWRSRGRRWMSQANRQLGFWMCTALVVGNMIGAGIFLLPSSLAPYGLNTIPAWLLTAGGAMVLAVVFAGLSRAFPTAGGP